MGKVLVFGTFDKLNAGHIAFLEEASRFGDELIALVLQDEFVTKYKGKPPAESLPKRLSAVRSLPLKVKVYEEDVRQNWVSLLKLMPDVIVLSADQASWRHRLDPLLKEYNLSTKVVVLTKPERNDQAN